MNFIKKNPYICCELIGIILLVISFCFPDIPGTDLLGALALIEIVLAPIIIFIVKKFHKGNLKITDEVQKQNFSNLTEQEIIRHLKMKSTNRIIIGSILAIFFFLVLIFYILNDEKIEVGPLITMILIFLSTLVPIIVGIDMRRNINKWLSNDFLRHELFEKWYANLPDDYNLYGRMKEISDKITMDRYNKNSNNEFKDSTIDDVNSMIESEIINKTKNN